MAALWEILGKAANLVQLLGLDAFTIISVAFSGLLWLGEMKKGCQKLEERVRVLRQMLMYTQAGCLIMMQQQQHMELGDLVTCALRDAQALIEYYKASTFLLRIRRGRSMARQFQDLYNRIDSYCGIILTVNACLLVIQANPPRPSVVRNEANHRGV